MEYKGYLIEIDNTGFAPKNMLYSFYLGGEEYIGSGESVEDCKRQIDEIDE
jgi:hypothetical protein